jgi:hypothetical protein
MRVQHTTSVTEIPLHQAAETRHCPDGYAAGYQLNADAYTLQILESS